MFGKLFGRKKPKENRKVSLDIQVDYVTATAQKRYAEFEQLSQELQGLGFVADSSKYEVGNYFVFELDKPDLSARCTVNVYLELKDNAKGESTIDYFEYEAYGYIEDDEFDEEVEGSKRSNKVLTFAKSFVEKIKAKAMQD